jgi:hypothetical protein
MQGKMILEEDSGAFGCSLLRERHCSPALSCTALVLRPEIIRCILLEG